MIETREDSFAEMAEITGTPNKQGMLRKLERWGVSLSTEGYGTNIKIMVEHISNPFKIYCITELGFAANADFTKVRNLYYYFFNDDEFQEARMRGNGRPVSRQAIAGYIAKLDAKNFIRRNTGDYLYYFAHKQQQRFVERSEYIKAWREYWEDIDSGLNSGEAISFMIANYGGIARKQEKPTLNSFYISEVETICNLIQESLENEQTE